MQKKINKSTKRKGINLRSYGYVRKLDPKRMLIRLPILLARIYAGFNSKGIMEETKKVLDSLYRSRMITDTGYNHLANI